MAKKGLSLHIGLNSVDPNHYNGWDGKLTACEYDANDMQMLAKKQGFIPKVLLTRDATRDAVMKEIRAIGASLVPGDMFFLSYSGHGGQVPNRAGSDVEKDAYDETWVLYNGQLVDDEIHAMLCDFQPGVHVVVLSDSCHSGTVTKVSKSGGVDVALKQRIPVSGLPITGLRMMPLEVAGATYRAHQAFYDEIAKPQKPLSALKAGCLLISGCQDNQTSADGAFNGLFTAMLLRVWQSGDFQGSYRTLHRLILQEMPADQTPNLFYVGPSGAKREILKERPFTI